MSPSLTPSRIESEQRPSEVLTMRNVAFTIAAEESEVGERVEQLCAALAGQPKAHAYCLERQRAEFTAHVMQFTRDAAGELVWQVLRRDGNSLIDVYQSFCELADETTEAVTVRLVGVPRGKQPLFQGQKEFRVHLPDKYGLVVEDPKYGELRYISKVGLVTAD